MWTYQILFEHEGKKLNCNAKMSWTLDSIEQKIYLFFNQNLDGKNPTLNGRLICRLLVIKLWSYKMKTKLDSQWACFYNSYCQLIFNGTSIKESGSRMGSDSHTDGVTFCENLWKFWLWCLLKFKNKTCKLLGLGFM